MYNRKSGNKNSKNCEFTLFCFHGSIVVMIALGQYVEAGELKTKQRNLNSWKLIYISFCLKSKRKNEDMTSEKYKQNCKMQTKGSKTKDCVHCKVAHAEKRIN